MILKYLVHIFLFLSIASFSQIKDIDSLKNELQLTKEENKKILLLNEISDNYKFSDPNKTEEFALKALELSKASRNRLGEASSYYNIGISNIVKSNYSEAIKNFQAAKEIFEEQSIKNYNELEILNNLGKTYGSIGIVFSEQSNYAKAIEFYLKASKIFEKNKNEAQCSKLYNNIGVAYKSQNQEEKALEYFEKAKQLQEKYSDVNIGITLTNIANIYFNKKQLDKAFDYYSQAKIHIDKSSDKRALGEWYNNIGSYFLEKGKVELVLENWNKAIESFESVNDKFGLTDTYIFFAKYYFNQNDNSKALEFAQKGLHYASEMKVLEQVSIIEKLLSDIYEKQGDNAFALVHYKKYSTIKDNLNSDKNLQKSIELSMQYEFEKRELVNKEENEKKELLLKEEVKNFRTKFLFSALVLLLIFGIGFLIYSKSQLKKTLTLQKELAVYEQKALHLQMNPHFVFNCLGSISSFIVQNGTDSAIKYLSKFSKLMRLTLEYSKESLIPIDKEMESLQNYLELEQLRFNYKFDFSIKKDNEIEDDTALPPLLIQPFIENAIIHGVVPSSEKGKISIDFNIDDEFLFCTVIDNGIGINESKSKKKKLCSCS